MHAHPPLARETQAHRARSRAPRLRASVLFGVLQLSVLVLGCSQQEEGERCDPSNNSSDCESGLRCVPLASLHRGTEGAVCCPSDPTADICLQVDFTGNDDGEPPTSTVPTTPSTSEPEQPDSDAAAAPASDASSPVDGGSSAPAVDASFGDASFVDAGPLVDATVDAQ